MEGNNMAEIDWTKSMQQTFEFWVVDPDTWLDERRLEFIKGCTINRDSSDETLGSATIDGIGMSGEFYIRVYLIAIQNRMPFKEPLGTFLVQTQFASYNGHVETLSIQAYTPLMELKEKYPPIGYALYKGDKISDSAYYLMRNNLRAPVIRNDSISKTITSDTGFISEPEESYLTFVRALLSNADASIDLDALGNVLYGVNRDIRSMKPRMTFDDGNSSILYPDISTDYDLYKIPNVVEIVISNSAGYYTTRAVNDDPTSKISTVTRKREVVYRLVNPDELSAINTESVADKAYISQYAKKLLKQLSSIDRTISYTHGYCPVRVGDCVLINYKRSGIINVKAVVTSQSIQCVPGCPVSETAVYKETLWGG